MKTITKLFSFVLMVLISCQTATAQPSPVTTKKYSNAEIEKMIFAHKSAYSTDVMPSGVLQQQLLKDFPNARDIDWEIAANVYEADFEVGRTDYKAYYDEQANLLMYTQEISVRSIPAVVKNAAQAKYPNFKFEDAKKIVQGSEVLYALEMEKGDMDVKATFKADGTFSNEIFD